MVEKPNMAHTYIMYVYVRTYIHTVVRTSIRPYVCKLQKIYEHIPIHVRYGTVLGVMLHLYFSV